MMKTTMVLFHQVFQIYDFPEDIVFDQVTEFTSRIWRAFCNQLGINISFTSSYYPQSIVQMERLNQEIGCYLRTYYCRATSVE